MKVVCNAVSRRVIRPNPGIRLVSVPLRLVMDVLKRCSRQTKAIAPASKENLALKVRREFSESWKNLG